MNAAAKTCHRLGTPLVQLALSRRCWSSSTPELPSLKAALRAIYKRVHPDLFEDHQAAKDANTRSFKLLHEYVEAAGVGSKVPLPYRFHFFVRSGSAGGMTSSPGSPAATAATAEQEEAEPAGSKPGPPDADPTSKARAATAGTEPSGLREVVLTLPPPTRGAPGEAMSGSTRKAFGSLLAALGLPSRFGVGAEDDVAAEQYNRFVSLREFLPQAVETMHQHAALQSSAQHQLAALRTALRLGRRVSVGFGEPAASAGVLQQLILLQRMVATLDSLLPPPDLSGLKLMVGQASGVDALGTVWLAADGSQEAWARHLGSIDAEHCRQRQQLLATIKSQEGAVAVALGLAMVYPQQQEARLAPDYRHALDRLAAAAAHRGPIVSGRFRDLPLMLRPISEESRGGAGSGKASPSSRDGSKDGSSAAGSSASQQLGGCAADSTAGLLCAPLNVSGDELYVAVQQLGGQVLAALQRRRRQDQELATLRTQVERKVMLRRLLRDSAVSDARYKSCMERMLGSAQKLSGLLHGQAVRVAEVNAVSPDRSVIDIAWNWQL